MNLSKIIKGLADYDSATVQNALMTMDNYDKEQIDYSSPELKSYYLGPKPVVGIAVTCKVTPLYEPKNKLDVMIYLNESVPNEKFSRFHLRYIQNGTEEKLDDSTDTIREILPKTAEKI